MSRFDTSRRRMLAAFASAATLAATGAKAEMQECSQLEALADRLPRTLDNHLSAVDAVKKIVAEWSPVWPTPEDIAITFGEGSKPHCTIDGRGVVMPREGLIWKDTVNVGTAAHFQDRATAHRETASKKAKTISQRGMKPQIRMAERCEAAIEPARAYWSEVERIKQVSGIHPAMEHEAETRRLLQELVGRIMLTEERTVAGLIIKAQAMQAWSKVKPFFRTLNLDANTWADAMAATVIRQTT